MVARQKCPDCGEKLRKASWRVKCPDCGWKRYYRTAQELEELRTIDLYAPCLHCGSLRRKVPAVMIEGASSSKKNSPP